MGTAQASSPVVQAGTASFHIEGLFFMGLVSVNTSVYFHYSLYFYRLFLSRFF